MLMPGEDFDSLVRADFIQPYLNVTSQLFLCTITKLMVTRALQVVQVEMYFLGWGVVTPRYFLTLTNCCYYRLKNGKQQSIFLA